MSRILVISERFWPEDFLVNDFVAEWHRRGDKIEVLTQVPSYPLDRIFDGYRNVAQMEHWQGIAIHRVSTVLGYNRSVGRKIWNYIHFAVATMWWALRHGRSYDRVFVYHTAALLMAVSALPLKMVWRKKITIWTQDLWPDAVYAYGFRPTWWKRILLNAFVRLIYRTCSRICVSCPSYVDRIRALTGRTAEFIPQWDPVDYADCPLEGAVSKRSDRKMVFMFAGNLGVPQNLENDIDGFLRADLPDAELWLVGGGVRLEALKAKYAGAKGVRFCGRQSRESMPQWFAQADVLVISLTSAYRLTFPAKFQSYIKTGRPLLGIIEGDVRRLIEEERLGWTARPDDIAGIASAYRAAAEGVQSGESSSLGRNARGLSERLFDRAVCISRLISS